MEIALQFVNDSEGNTQAVQLSVSEWKKVVNTIKKYEQSLKLSSDLNIALAQVSKLRKSGKKQTLTEFLDEI